jgi:hypothetical protein
LDKRISGDDGAIDVPFTGLRAGAGGRSQVAALMAMEQAADGFTLVSGYGCLQVSLAGLLLADPALFLVVAAPVTLRDALGHALPALS